MEIIYLSGVSLIAFVTLIKSVDSFVSAATKIAKHLKISVYTISFLLVAIATSLPETMVGITSAIDHNPILSFGNAIGSNIALVTLIAAIPILFFRPIPTRSIVASKDVYIAAFFCFLPLMLITDGVLSRLEGVVLLAMYAAYMVFVLKQSKGIERIMDSLERINLAKQAFLFIVSLAFLLLASEVIVKTAAQFSVILNLSLGFVGLSITAVGTSLPEIAVSIAGARKNKSQQVLGNIVGSLIANSTLVLGITAVITPITITNTFFGIQTICALFLAVAIFLKFVRSRETLDKKEAFLLLGFYIVFILMEFKLQNLSQ